MRILLRSTIPCTAAFAALVLLLLAGCAPSTAQPSATAPSPSAPGPLEHVFQRLPDLLPGAVIRFDRLGIERGLSMSTVRDIVQDQTGYVWIATEDGLNRFDGDSVEIWRHDAQDPQSIGANNLLRLLAASDGSLWIGTNSDGIDRFDPITGAFAHFRAEGTDSAGLPSNSILALIEDDSGFVWAGTAEGLTRLDPAVGSWVSIPSSAEGTRPVRIYALHASGDGTLWVGSQQGLFLLDIESLRYLDLGSAPLERLGGEAVRSLEMDATGRLWVGTQSSGLYRLNPDSGGIIQFKAAADSNSGSISNEITALHVDGKGDLWIGTGAGLQRKPVDRNELERYPANPQDPTALADDAINVIAEDRSGGIWVGTSYGGAARFDRLAHQFALIQSEPGGEYGLSANSIWTIYEDPADNLWLGTNGGGLSRLHRPTGRWESYRADEDQPGALSHDVVMDIAPGDDGALWIGTWGGGLNRFDPNSGRFLAYRHDPKDLASITSDVVWIVQPDGEGRLWLGTDSGLDRFDPATGTAEHFHHDPLQEGTLSSDRIGAITISREGTLWVGTHAGLDRFDPGAGTFTHFPADPESVDGLSHPIVFSIWEDQAGVLWIATYGGGVNRFDPKTGVFSRYGTTEGLPNDSVYGILEDDEGYLWFSTNYGLARFDRTEQTFRTFTVADGLQSPEFNFGAYFKNERGELFFGGTHGLNVVSPERIVENPYPPTVVLRSFSQQGEPLAIVDGQNSIPDLTLRWPNNYMDFEFTSLNYFRPQDDGYAYYLQGFDSTWNDAGDRSFGRYTNLPGGSYTLFISAANNDGLWSEPSRVAEVEIIPAFWTTWWFRGVLLIALVGTLGAGYQLRIRGLAARSLALREMVQQRTADLEQRSREAEALYAADEKLLSHLELEEVLQALVVTAVDILEADKGSVLAWDAAHNALHPVASTGFGAGTLEQISFRPGQGIAGIVAETRELIAVEDTERDPRVTHKITEAEGIRSFMQAPITIGDEVFGVFSADYSAPRSFGEREKRLLTSLANRAALAIENARLYEDTRLRLAESTSLQRMVSAIASTLQLDDLLSMIVEQAVSLLGASAGILNLVDWERGEDQVVACVGAYKDAFLFDTAPLDQTLSGWVSRHNEPVILDHPRDDPRVNLTSLIKDDEIPLNSLAAAPLSRKGEVLGTLVITDKDNGRGTFDQADLKLLMTFARQAAMAIENARLYAQAQQLAVVEERQRLARELHDSVTQCLYSITLYAEAMGRHLDADHKDHARSQLRELQLTAKEALREMRLLIFQLRPPDLEREGLVAMLRTRLEAVEERAGLKTGLQAGGVERLPMTIEEGLYRIAQEALNNSLKHAEASRIDISLQEMWGEVMLEVVDNGIGFDPETAVEYGGLGMEGMQERAAELGGTLEIMSEPGKGACIRVRVPR